MDETPIEITLKVISILDSLGVRYFIGGSIASSLYGNARSTLDSDVVAELDITHVSPFVSAVQTDFYVDEDAINAAIRNRSSFNLIHYKTAFKVDIFLPKNRAFEICEFENRILRQPTSNTEQKAYFASAEDIVLAKLEWYRLGNEVSDRQWSDISEIIKIQGKNLDLEYLRKLAIELKVSDLLERALETNRA
ncbi:MAG TPA: hypothetical protein V6D22_22545 [Candidatus Obscuribacterales bacterium]